MYKFYKGGIYKMYMFNRVTVVPKLPKRIEKLADISNNLWWSWNTELLRLFQVKHTLKDTR